MFPATLNLFPKSFLALDRNRNSCLLFTETADTDTYEVVDLRWCLSNALSLTLHRTGVYFSLQRTFTATPRIRTMYPYPHIPGSGEAKASTFV